MFLVALPVIIGDHLFGIMAVFGRAVSWEMPGELEDAGFEGESSLPLAGQGARADTLRLFADLPTNEEAFDAPPPDPMALFTILYGIYPCNFAAFLKDAGGYLKSKDWKGASGDGALGLDSAIIRDRSKASYSSFSLPTKYADPPL
jgi:hypothetical protein